MDSNLQRLSITSISVQQSEASIDHQPCSVRVAVRVRPLNSTESLASRHSVIKVADENLLIFDPKELELGEVSKQAFSFLEKRVKDLHFTFDRVFDTSCSNEEVFEHTTKPVIADILNGYNCCVFAYGATSAGKTHTMLGSSGQPGVIFLTMMELYKQIKLHGDEVETDLAVSYLEIYNETCKDLLLPTGPLAVREDPDKGVCVSGLSLHKPRSAEDLLNMLYFGNQNRTQHPTDANAQSSRSHAIFQIFVKQRPKDAGLTAKVKMSKVSLIDLAGSERATVTTNRGDRLREGANINKSLLALGNCINALAENKSNLYVPYRNSKLTRLLKDSLGGNCRTVMIAAISPSLLSYEDTYNTLKYADRAKSIKSTLSSNTLNVDFHVSQYAKIVQELKEQINVLQKKVATFESGNAGPHLPQETKEDCTRYEQRLSSLFKERGLFKKQMIDCEATTNSLAFKLANKERNFCRLERLCADEDFVQQALAKLQEVRSATALKQSKLAEQRCMLSSSLDENQSRLATLRAEVDNWANRAGDTVKEKVNSIYETWSLRLENMALKIQSQHLRRCFALAEGELKSSENLVKQLIQIVVKQKRISEARRTSTSPMNASFEDRVRELSSGLLAGPKVSWADQTVTDDASDVTLADMVNLSTCTPFKTPSNKPAILRYLVMQSRSPGANMQTSESQRARSLYTNSTFLANIDKESAPHDADVCGKMDEVIIGDKMDVIQFAEGVGASIGEIVTDCAESCSGEARRHADQAPSSTAPCLDESPPCALLESRAQVARKVLTTVNSVSTDTSGAPTASSAFQSSIPIRSNDSHRKRPTERMRRLPRSRSFTDDPRSYSTDGLGLNRAAMSATPAYAKATISQMKKRKIFAAFGKPVRANVFQQKENIRPRSQTHGHDSMAKTFSYSKDDDRPLATITNAVKPRSLHMELARFRF